MNIQALKLIATQKIGRGGLVLKKYAPEIMLFAGVGGIVGATILACMASTKADVTLENAKYKLDRVKRAKKECEPTDYSETDYQKDLLIVYTQTAVDFVKLYGPAVTLGAVSIGLILGSHGLMKSRNVALVAAYKVLETGFIEYRERAIAEFGEEKDRQFRFGTTQVTSVETVVDDDGKKTKVKKTTEVADPTKLQSQYAELFDERSIHWKKDHSFNLVFIQCQQNFANEMLQVRGHVFLNEVLDSLGLERKPYGQIVGWVRKKDGEIGFTEDGGLRRYQNAIDFGVFDVENPAKTEFIRGNERSIWLDFNVDEGVMWDKI